MPTGAEPVSGIVDAERLTEVSAADVYKDGVLAATLTRTERGVAFGYVAGYEGPAVASTLPHGTRSVERPGGALPAYFAGLLPEGRRLGALRRAIKTSLDDELSLLLAVGVDTIGNVDVVPHGHALGGVAPRVRLDPDRPMRFADLLTDLDLRPDRRGLPGVQDKASAAMINVPAARAGQSLILKLDPPEYPGLVRNEHVMLAAAGIHGLQAASAELLTDADGACALAVVRFDRPGDHRLAVEDGCQVQGRVPGEKYTVGYPSTFRALGAVCDARPLALRTLLAQLTFAILTGNGDAHAKNFSVLQAPDGEWQVSPAYDVPSSYPYGDTTLAMSVNSRRSDVGGSDLLALAKDVGLPARAALRVLREAAERVEGWLPLLEGLPYDAGRIATLTRVVRQRRARIAMALS